jgi:hypothetical protein
MFGALVQLVEVDFFLKETVARVDEGLSISYIVPTICWRTSIVHCSTIFVLKKEQTKRPKR